MYKIRGMIGMNRTVNCKNCGEVELYIDPTFEQIVYKCSKCHNVVGTVKSTDRYMAPHINCIVCNNNLFKVKTTDDSGEEVWDGRCINCDSQVEWYFSDKSLNQLKSGSRRELLLKEYIEDLEEENNELRVQLSAMQYRLESARSNKFGTILKNVGLEKALKERENEIKKLRVENDELKIKLKEVDGTIVFS